MIHIDLRRVTRLVVAGLLILVLQTEASWRTVQQAAAMIPSGPILPLGGTNTWITDGSGRVVVLHGLNQVYIFPPYEPSADGFGDDDAAFLAANGFNAMRLGVFWTAVEPQPLTYDDTYLASIAQTVQTLAAHGIVSLLDMHQDMYNEIFQGEGAPAWAVPETRLPNPQFGFPNNYFLNPALENAYAAFWRDAPAPDGIGVEDHFARAWAHVAEYFRTNTAVFGYEAFNEPFPGFVWEGCLNPVLGCPIQDHKLTNFYKKIVPIIRAADPTRLVFFQPNQLFAAGIHTDLGKVIDPHTAFAFHDYCATENTVHVDVGCPVLDAITQTNGTIYAKFFQIPQLMTEFGATNHLKNITEVIQQADLQNMGWLEWAYTGNDPTSTAPNAQALVYNPALPPTGDNVNTAKLAALAEPYPQVVAGTPKFWAFRRGEFQLSYTTERADHHGSFVSGEQTVISVPPIEYPNGYQVSVKGGQVTSAPGAALLTVVADPGASTVEVVVRADG
ncbi:cellulase family glycosylhydrolase [Mycobacterium kansasii]|uniref:cellulase family glycosylhydrolase n=1 Tax=Mycobacterium kansasii TaxID=1768 RepID=UPI001604D182|nr:cellulase family glycosylhydrolase [Mycobacterium kansasii]